MLDSTGDRIPKTKKYVPASDGKRSDRKKPNRCPSCGRWRVSENFAEPCPRCLEMNRGDR